MGIHGRWCDATQGIDDALVESAIDTGLGANTGEVSIGSESSPLLFGIVAESGAIRELSISKLGLLRVHSPFHEARTTAKHSESRADLGGQRAHEEMRALAICMRDGDEGVVVDLHTGTPPVELGVDVACGTEQDQRLVDEMTAEIEEQPAGLVSRAPLTPVVSRCGTPSLEAGLEAKRRTQRVFGKETSNGEKVPIPPAVLEDGENEPSALGFSHQRTRFVHARGEWLVDHDVEAVGKRFVRERRVRAIRGCDDDDIDIGGVPQAGWTVDDPGGGVGQRRRSLPLRISGGDRHEAESWCRRDQWCMERGTTQAVANESDAERRRSRCQLKRPLCGLVGICWSCLIGPDRAL